MERNTVERAIKTEIDTEQNKKEWASLVGLFKKTLTPASPPHEFEPMGMIYENRYYCANDAEAAVTFSG